MNSHKALIWATLLVLALAAITILFFRKPIKPRKLTTREQSVVVAATNTPVETNMAAQVKITNQPDLQSNNVAATFRPTDRKSPLSMTAMYLELTDEQAKKLEPILEKQQRQMLAFRRDTSLSRQQRIVRLKQMRETNDDQLKSVLAPEQFKKWRHRGLAMQQAFQQPHSQSANDWRTNAAFHDFSRPSSK